MRNHNEYINRHHKRLMKTLRFLGNQYYADILDLGCYPSTWGLLLNERYPQSHVVMADCVEPPITLGGEKLDFGMLLNLPA